MGTASFDYQDVLPLPSHHSDAKLIISVMDKACHLFFLLISSSPLFFYLPTFSFLISKDQRIGSSHHKIETFIARYSHGASLSLTSCLMHQDTWYDLTPKGKIRVVLTAIDFGKIGAGSIFLFTLLRLNRLDFLVNLCAHTQINRDHKLLWLTDLRKTNFFKQTL